MNVLNIRCLKRTLFLGRTPTGASHNRKQRYHMLRIGSIKALRSFALPLARLDLLLAQLCLVLVQAFDIAILLR